MGAGIAAAMAAAMGTKTEQELARVKSALQAFETVKGIFVFPKQAATFFAV